MSLATDKIIVQPPTTEEKEVFDFTRYQIGGGILKVQIHDDALRSFLNLGLKLYSRYLPALRWFSHPGYAGVQRYQLKADTIGYGVQDVFIPRLDPIAPLLLSSGPRLDIFGYRYSYPYRDISEVYMDYFYFKEATRVLSADFEWRFIDGALLVSPKPDEAFPLTYCSNFPHDLRTIPADDVDWIYKYVLARAKIAVGNVRSQYVIPGQQTMQKLNGDQLLSQGVEELKEAEEGIRERAQGHLPIMRT